LRRKLNALQEPKHADASSKGFMEHIAVAFSCLVTEFLLFAEASKLAI
jgi:hypothetical protein